MTARRSTESGFVPLWPILGFIVFFISLFALMYIYQDSAFKYLKAILAGTNLVIYKDEFATGWKNWTLSGGVDTQNSSQAFEGRYSIAFTPTKAGDELYLHSQDFVDTSIYTVLKFAVKSSQPGQKFQVQFYDQTQRLIVVPLDKFGGDPQPDQWKLYLIPLSELGADRQKITAFGLQETGGQLGPVYLDDIELLKSSFR